MHVLNIAVNTRITFLITFNAPGNNSNQSSNAIKVANEWTPRITLASIFAR